MMTTTLRSALTLVAAALAALPAAHAYAQAQPQAADKPVCQYVQLAKVPLHYTGLSLGITMDGTINGTPALMLADTGFHQSYLTRTGTEKRGLRLRPTAHHLHGVGGVSTVYTTQVDEFAAGPAKSSKGWIEVVGDTGSAPWFDAFVGAPYLLQTDMELAVADKEIRFFRPLGCEKSWLAYWSRDAIVIPFEQNQMSNTPVNPPFTIEVNGAKMLAIIDSGATRTSIDAHAAQRAGIRIDGPGVVRSGSSVGVGGKHVTNWRARVATIKIGDEIVRDGEVALMDTGGQLGIDVLLGDDFLRAHRVLFAMSQKKIYLSYIGGDIFGSTQGIEPWVQKEADDGNPDAQMVVALHYRTGNGVPKNRLLADDWLNKAAAQGHPQAKLTLGRELMYAGRHADAVAHLKPALDKLPAERYGALWLYLERLRTGEQEQGRRELEATFARSEDNAWPGPIGDYYLGRIDAAALQKRASRDEEHAAVRSCQAGRYIAELQAAQAGQALPAAPAQACAPANQ
jgi:predicted aspartyl protease